MFSLLNVTSPWDEIAAPIEDGTPHETSPQKRSSRFLSKTTCITEMFLCNERSKNIVKLIYVARPGAWDMGDKMRLLFKVTAEPLHRQSCGG